MEILKSDIIPKIRTAIDDIEPTAADSFKDDTVEELWQAVEHAVEALSMELPMDMLLATVQNEAGIVDADRGFAYFKLNEGFLRFVSIDITGTAGVLFELIEPGSDAEKMQRSPWSRGSATKPKAMLDHDENGDKVIVWWPGTGAHGSAQLAYIETPKVEDVTEEINGTTTVTDQKITCSLKDAAEPMVIYRAASIFFEGKKEPETAEKFRNI